jgi:serine/threonine protein kinase
MKHRDSKGRVRQLNAKSLDEMLGSDTEDDFKDFIKKCLDWNPDTRMKPEEAFQHPWILPLIEKLKKKQKIEVLCDI